MRFHTISPSHLGLTVTAPRSDDTNAAASSSTKSIPFEIRNLEKTSTGVVNGDSSEQPLVGFEPVIDYGDARLSTSRTRSRPADAPPRTRSGACSADAAPTPPPSISAPTSPLPSHTTIASRPSPRQPKPGVFPRLPASSFAAELPGSGFVSGELSGREVVSVAVGKGERMATAGAPLHSTAFLGRTGGFARAEAPVKDLERSVCRVACSSGGVGCRVREGLRMAVIVPVAACAVLAASPLQADAGILSGASGMESVQLPSIPEPDFLKKIQDEKKKMYQGQDETFRTSSYLQELLKKSKDNAAMHKKEIADKYCERGAEWGVGDCSLMGMTQAQKEEFMRVLKQK